MSHSSLVSELPPQKRNRKQVEDMVINTLARRLKKQPQEITLNTRFEELGVDSLDMAELIFLLEDQLLKTIPLEQGVRLETVGEAVTLVFKHVNANQLAQESAKHQAKRNPI